ncbi:biosurfactant protein 1 [Halomicrobium urmianum]|uniref:biosurfactant protein 1 n=1 Tax=Halomicrobium urmianum TaxID=1586233 RepID=UPI001CD9AE61|nr:hypothetical protein [Halomicrobium urmianum]
MHNRYSDFEELRPTGEASHIPDEQVNRGCNGDPQRQRMATSTWDYPDESTDADRECQSCGASIPAGQTKCRFCLSNHLDTEAASADETTDETFLGIVHMVVESTNLYGAVAKGEVAANFLASNDAEPAVDDYTLIYDLDETPATQLSDRWPSLPAAVQLDSTESEQLLTAARDRTGWHGQDAVGNQQQAPTRLYDHRGNGIRDQVRLKEIIDDADDEIWLVPAIALTAIADERSESRLSLIPTKTCLDCQDCGRATNHQFKGQESIPDEEWTAQPIWECQVCGTPRYGPVPE